VSLTLLWADDSWQVESGIGVGAEPVWQRHGSPAHLAALLSEGFGVTWTQAHDDVRPLDPQATLAAMAGHDGSLSSWIDTGLAGARPFTVVLDSGGGAVAMLRRIDPRTAGSAPGSALHVLAAGLVDDDTANVDLRARNWTAEVDRWDLAARPWLVETAAWLNARASHDWRVAAWWLPEAAALRPRIPLLAHSCAEQLDRFLDLPEPFDASTPATYGLPQPTVTGTWLLLVEWSPRSGEDDEPAGVLGLVRTDSGGADEVRCFHWSLRSLPTRPHAARVNGDDVWPLDRRLILETMLGTQWPSPAAAGLGTHACLAFDLGYVSRSELGGDEIDDALVVVEDRDEAPLVECRAGMRDPEHHLVADCEFSVVV